MPPLAVESSHHAGQGVRNSGCVHERGAKGVPSLRKVNAITHSIVPTHHAARGSGGSSLCPELDSKASGTLAHIIIGLGRDPHVINSTIQIECGRHQAVGDHIVTVKHAE